MRLLYERELGGRKGIENIVESLLGEISSLVRSRNTLVGILDSGYLFFFSFHPL